MSDVLKEIRTRGYWVVTIRPATFEASREQNPMRLAEFVQQKKVRMGGWSFPQFDPNSDPTIGPDYVEQGGHWAYHIELWRLYQSGQFVSNKACYEDWPEHFSRYDKNAPKKPGSELHVYPTLLLIASVCEFAARLALSSVGSDRMVIQVRLRGMKGRRLLIRNLLRGELYPEKVAGIEEYVVTREVARDELVAAASELGISMTHELFVRFSWDPPLSILRDIHRDMAPFEART